VQGCRGKQKKLACAKYFAFALALKNNLSRKHRVELTKSVIVGARQHRKDFVMSKISVKPQIHRAIKKLR
jgi:hypothetical protein